MDNETNDAGNEKQRTTKQKVGRVMFCMSLIIFIISISVGLYSIFIGDTITIY